MSTERIVWRDRLRPFAEHIYKINKKIFDATDEDLRALAKACRRVTRTNCGWGEYRIAPLLAELVREELGRRRLSRKIAKKTRGARLAATA